MDRRTLGYQKGDPHWYFEPYGWRRLQPFPAWWTFVSWALFWVCVFYCPATVLENRNKSAECFGISKGGYHRNSVVCLFQKFQNSFTKLHSTFWILLVYAKGIFELATLLGNQDQNFGRKIMKSSFGIPNFGEKSKIGTIKGPPTKIS